MRYADGQLIAPGDTVEIDGQYRGRVIACMDTNRCLPGAEGWAYLETGIMVDTDFGGLVHYTDLQADQIVLITRGTSL